MESQHTWAGARSLAESTPCNRPDPAKPLPEDDLQYDVQRAITDPAVALSNRLSQNGAALRVIGIVVDSLHGFVLDAVTTREVRLGLGSVEVVDGVFDDAWHVVVVKRPVLIDGQSQDAFAPMKALRLLGVRQVISSSFGEFDPDSYLASIGIHSERAADFIDLSDAPDATGSMAATSCERVGAALRIALDGEGIELLADDVQPFLTSTTTQERTVAVAFGMCYAAIDVVSPLTIRDARAVQKRLAKVLQEALGSISPMASCTCAGGLDS